MSLASIVRDYRAGPGRNRAKTMKRFRAMPSLSEAIRQAALARREDGKCESHQRRVAIVALRPFERNLQRSTRSIQAAATFEDLYGLVEASRTPRVGSLTVYDTAVRIGAYLRLEPGEIHLHAGTRAGAAALGLPVRGGRLDPALLPGALSGLKPDEAEDCLCIYKDWLAGAAGARARGGGRGARGRGC